MFEELVSSVAISPLVTYKLCAARITQFYAYDVDFSATGLLLFDVVMYTGRY